MAVGLGKWLQNAGEQIINVGRNAINGVSQLANNAKKILKGEMGISEGIGRYITTSIDGTLKNLAHSGINLLRGTNEPLKSTYDTLKGDTVYYDENLNKEIEENGNTSQSTEEALPRQETDQKELWAREDQIRAETQQREDTAYQRAVEDMRKAGINPNLLGVQPANSGGGITSATTKNYSNEQLQLQQNLEYALNEINNNFTGNENTKRNLVNIITAIGVLALKFIK